MVHTRACPVSTLWCRLWWGELLDRTDHKGQQLVWCVSVSICTWVCCCLYIPNFNNKSAMLWSPRATADAAGRANCARSEDARANKARWDAGVARRQKRRKRHIEDRLTRDSTYFLTQTQLYKLQGCWKNAEEEQVPECDCGSQPPGTNGSVTETIKWYCTYVSLQLSLCL